LDGTSTEGGRNGGGAVVVVVGRRGSIYRYKAVEMTRKNRK
jgi:hypothetical protein